ncbi:hypothetical protein OAB00_04410 [Akkermansiaceae bacterium]|nr:hypothetical protein [Akkermansiaceae bacterium]
MTLDFSLNYKNLNKLKFQELLRKVHTEDKTRFAHCIEGERTFNAGEMPLFEFEESSWYLTHSGVRGVWIEDNIRTKEIFVRLPSFAGFADFLFMAKYLEAALECGGEVVDFTKNMDMVRGDFTQEFIDAQFGDWWMTSKKPYDKHLARQEDFEISLISPIYSIILDNNALQLDDSSLYEHVQRCVAKYTKADRAMLMNIQDANGEDLKLSIYANNSTMFDRSVDKIGLLNNMETGLVDAEEFFHVASKFVDVSWHDNWVFVDGILDIRVKEFVHLLRELSQSNLLNLENMLHKDEAMLKFLESPLLIFVYVAMADGVIDSKELTEFVSTILMVMKDEHLNLAASSLAYCAKDTQDKINAIYKKGDPALRLVETNTAIDKLLDPRQAKIFKEGLLKLAFKIANASKGKSLIAKSAVWKSNVHKSEKEAKQVIASVFGLDYTDFIGFDGSAAEALNPNPNL